MYYTYRYTLRNAEYRLSLEKNLEIYVGDNNRSGTEDYRLEAEGTYLNEKGVSGNFDKETLPTSDGAGEMKYDIPDFGGLTPEARQHILKLHSHLSSVKKVYFNNFIMCIPTS